MLPSEPIATRKLVVDTETPGTEIFITDAKGDFAGGGIRKVEAELPVALYKIRYRVGDRVTDTLIELTPGQNPFYAPVPPLPILSPGPPVRIPGAPADQTTEFAHSIIEGPRVVSGSGASLFVFVTADLASDSAPANPAAALSIRDFSGEMIGDLTNAQTQGGCAGSAFELDPGRYLLRAIWDAGPAIEQTIVVARDWQTRVYIRLIETGLAQPETPIPSKETLTPGWKLDLPNMGVMMVRDFPGAEPSPDDARWTTAARQALAARRSEAAPNREMMGALLRGKFQNPMLGIYAGHLLAMQNEPDLDLLREVFGNLSDLVGEHPDVEALLIALRDSKAQELTYPEPPMLYASWALVLRASTTQHDLRPKLSYSARVAASLWGSGAWLSWRTPLPPDLPTPEPAPELLQTLIDAASAGRLETRLNDLSKRNVVLSPVERVLAELLLSMTKRLEFANELTADDDRSSIGGRLILPIYRRFVDSDLQRRTKEKIADEMDPGKLFDSSGIPYASILSAASTLANKLRLA